MAQFTTSIGQENINPLAGYFSAQTAGNENALAQQNLADRATLRAQAPNFASSDPATVAQATGTALSLPGVGGVQSAAGVSGMHADQRDQSDHMLTVGAGMAGAILSAPTPEARQARYQQLLPIMKQSGMSQAPDNYPGDDAMQALYGTAFKPEQRAAFKAQIPRFAAPGAPPVDPTSMDVSGGSIGAPAQGASIGPAPPVANADLPPEAQAFLPALAGGESKSYIDANGASTAKGRYQFLDGTWKTEAPKAGVSLGDMSPASQDKVAWNLATNTYKTNTGRDLQSDIREGGHEDQIAGALNKIWPSLPGGAQQNTSPQVWRQRMAAQQAAASSQQQTSQGSQPAPAQTAGAPPVGTNAPTNLVAGPAAPTTSPAAPGAPAGGMSVADAQNHPGLGAAQLLARTVLAAPPEQRAAVYAANRAEAVAGGAVDAPATYPGDAAMQTVAALPPPAPTNANPAAPPLRTSAAAMPYNPLLPSAGAPPISQSAPPLNQLAQQPQATPQAAPGGQVLLRNPLTGMPIPSSNPRIGMGPEGMVPIQGLPPNLKEVAHRDGSVDVLNMDDNGKVVSRTLPQDLDTLQNSADITSPAYLQAFERKAQGAPSGPDGRIVLPDMRAYRTPPGVQLDSQGHLIPSIGQPPPGTPNVTYSNRDRLNQQIDADRGQLPKLAAENQQQDQSLQLTLEAKKAAEGLPTGSNAESRLNMANWLKTYAPSIAEKVGVGADGSVLGDPGKLAEARKLLAASALQKEQAYGGSGGLGISENFMKNNPNIELQPDAIKDMSNLNAVTTVARKDYLLGKMAHVSSNISGQLDPNTTAKYSIPENFDAAWSTQNNTHTYLAAVEAMNGKPYSVWAKDLSSPQDQMRALAVVARLDPTSSVKGRDGVALPVAQFVPADPHNPAAGTRFVPAGQATQ